MKKNTLWVYAMLTALLLVLFGIPSALAAGTPTRTENLDLTALTVPEDHLADEGWKWEPTQEGGILTLRNFYQKCQHNNSGMISVKGKITLVLEGENVLETTSNLYQPLVTSPNGENADWTIRESEAGGSLTLKMPEGVGTQKYYPYGFFADHFVVESGTIHSEMVLCFANTFEMKGGNVTIDKNTGIYAAIQTLLGDVNLNGGKLTVRNAVCGVAAKSQEAYTITVDGAELDIQATVVGLSGKAILFQSGKAVVIGGTRATNVAADASGYQGPGFLVGSVDEKGMAPRRYDVSQYKTYKRIDLPHEHVGEGNWLSDDEEHWKLCKCTEKAETAAHQFGEWVTVEAATQTKEGVREHKCDICGKVVQEAIPFLPNTGDSAHPGVYALLLVLCGAALILLRRKQTVR